MSCLLIEVCCLKYIGLLSGLGLWSLKLCGGGEGRNGHTRGKGSPGVNTCKSCGLNFLPGKPRCAAQDLWSQDCKTGAVFLPSGTFPCQATCTDVEGIFLPPPWPLPSLALLAACHVIFSPILCTTQATLVNKKKPRCGWTIPVASGLKS